MHNTKSFILKPLYKIINHLLNKYGIIIYNTKYYINDLYYDIIATYKINIFEYKLLYIFNEIFGQYKYTINGIYK